MEPFAAVDISANPRGRITFGVPLDPFAPWSPDGGCGCGTGEAAAFSSDCGCPDEPAEHVEAPRIPAWNYSDPGESRALRQISGGAVGGAGFGAVGGPVAQGTTLPAQPRTAVRRRCFTDLWPGHGPATWEFAPCIEGYPRIDYEYYNCTLPTECSMAHGDPWADGEQPCEIPGAAETLAALDLLDFVWSPEIPLDAVERNTVEIFVAQSLALVRANLDLVKWALCATSMLDDVGKPGVRDPIGGDYDSTLGCIAGWLEGDYVMPVRFTYVQAPGCGALMRTQGWWDEPHDGIYIIPQVGSRWHSRFFARWLSAATPEDRGCILALHGALLVFGEGIHYCGNDIPHDDGVPDCDYTSAAWNLFLALMAERFPCLNTNQCSEFGDPGALVGSQGAIYPANSYPPWINPC